MSDTVTLALQGTVSLSDFSVAVARFNGLIAALAAESHVENVEWQIDALEYSSAITTARGVPLNGSSDTASIERVAHAYLEVGEALEQGQTVPFPQPVQKEARGLAELLSDSDEIEAVRFETAEADVIIRVPAPDQGPKLMVVEAKAEPSYGSVTGRVQTLSSRNALRFVVYDHIYDRAVSCYLVKGREAMMRQMWDRVATVEGWVTRDPRTGRPLTIRKVSSVTPLTEVEPGEYRRARGAIRRGEDDPLPEDQIRRFRDV